MKAQQYSFGISLIGKYLLFFIVNGLFIKYSSATNVKKNNCIGQLKTADVATQNA